MDEEGMAAYEAAMAESEAKGCKIRAVMVCNPHNPLGFCYSRQALKGYMRFCEKHDLHLVGQFLASKHRADTDTGGLPPSNFPDCR